MVNKLFDSRHRNSVDSYFAHPQLYRISFLQFSLRCSGWDSTSSSWVDSSRGDESSGNQYRRVDRSRSRKTYVTEPTYGGCQRECHGSILCIRPCCENCRFPLEPDCQISPNSMILCRAGKLAAVRMPEC